MKSFIALALAGAVSALDDTTFKFMQYLSKQNKSYASLEEFNMRLQNFADVEKFIQEWNANKENTSTVGHNFLSDWTAEEKKRLNGYGGERPVPKEAGIHQLDENQTAPTSVNWVTTGNVGAVQDQGQCGSCWAFSATGAAAAAMSIRYNSTPTYQSQQQLVSCSSSFGNQGCNGGWYFYAWNYMQTNAQVAASTYPYTSGNFGITGTCNTAALAPGVVNTQSPTAYVYAGRSNALMQSAIAIKPNSVAIEADQAVFQQYTGGVITSSACGTTIDHAVLAVGYGTDPTYGAYWLVQNSWGTSWGDQGYVKIGMSSSGWPGICGINKDVYYPNVQSA